MLKLIIATIAINLSLVFTASAAQLVCTDRSLGQSFEVDATKPYVTENELEVSVKMIDNSQGTMTIVINRHDGLTLK